jgi:N-acetylglutamate synthase/N-acetylornithine aminotransferase
MQLENDRTRELKDTLKQFYDILTVDVDTTTNSLYAVMAYCLRTLRIESSFSSDMCHSHMWGYVVLYLQYLQPR